MFYSLVLVLAVQIKSLPVHELLVTGMESTVIFVHLCFNIL